MNVRSEWAALSRRLLASVSDALSELAIDHVRWFVEAVERHWFDLTAAHAVSYRRPANRMSRDEWTAWCRLALSHAPLHAEMTHLSVFAANHVQTFVDFAQEDFARVAKRQPGQPTAA